VNSGPVLALDLVLVVGGDETKQRILEVEALDRP
jgi:hypothetical protein